MVSGWSCMCPLSVHPFIHLSCSLQSVVHPSVFSFLDNNLRKYLWIFSKLGMCIDIVEIWFGIANGQISSIFDRVIWLPICHTSVRLYFHFHEEMSVDFHKTWYVPKIIGSFLLSQ